MENKLEKQILKLETQMITMSRSISELKDFVQKEQNGKENFDIKKIEKYANQKKFKGHCTEELDEELAYKYCLLLAGAVELIKDREKRIRQYYFISRIFSVKSNRAFLEEMIQDANMISFSDMEILKEGISEEVRDLFLIDLLLMISFDGEVDSKQLEYFGEMTAFMEGKQNKLEQIAVLTKAVLEADLDLICSFASEFPVDTMFCYLSGKVADSLKELEKIKGENAILYNALLTDKYIDIDHYGKKKIRFVNCEFTNISEIAASKTEVELVCCSFRACSGNGDEWKVDDRGRKYDSLIKMDKCIIGNCEFIMCSDQGIYLIVINEGIIENTDFLNCSVRINVSEHKVFINKCKFQNCVVRDFQKEDVWIIGRSARPKRNVCLSDTEKNIKNCEFINCKYY